MMDADDAGSLALVPELTTEQVSESIWQLTQEIIELLRTQSTSEVQKQKRPEALWLDDVSRAQANTVIAVRQLCVAHPEGVTLKKVAETMGVSPAAASVMVDVLVKKKMLKRTRSRSDRRALLIRLHPETAGLFDICDQSLGQSVMSLGDPLGLQALHDWQRILVAASAALRDVVRAPTLLEVEPSEPSEPLPDDVP